MIKESSPARQRHSVPFFRSTASQAKAKVNQIRRKRQSTTTTTTDTISKSKTRQQSSTCLTLLIVRLSLLPRQSTRARILGTSLCQTSQQRLDQTGLKTGYVTFQSPTSSLYPRGTSRNSSRDFIDPRSTRPTGPATTFDHITAKLDLPPPPLEREPSLIKRAATATRQVLVGRTPSEKARKAAQDAAKAREEREKAERDEFVRGHRRELAIRGELTYDELYDLAVLEHVYLTPRRNRFDHDDYALADGVVARVSGRDENGEFVFLGSDKRLFLSRHDLGRGARPITAEQERHSHHYSHARGVAIAYYKLTF
ncbi:hypothetical protein F5Y10DRAFT_235367 [Nemania abortiva]|nr:hypothetical protein F5Y10DRAFT_235367 [Nemania abortiva]